MSQFIRREAMKTILALALCISTSDCSTIMSISSHFELHNCYYTTLHHYTCEQDTLQDNATRTPNNNNNTVIRSYMQIQNFPIALAVDIDRRGPSNEMRRQLRAKKTKVRLY